MQDRSLKRYQFTVVVSVMRITPAASGENSRGQEGRQLRARRRKTEARKRETACKKREEQPPSLVRADKHVLAQ